MSISLGAIIWSAVKPIIKIYLIIGLGILLAKLELLTVVGTKIISDLVLTVLLPCLAFSNIVGSIEGKDIKEIGIMCLSCIMLFATGMFFSVVVKLLLPVPKQWTGGIIAAGTFSNLSDLPVAYIQSIATGFILTPEEGQKGVACIMIFVTLFLFCVFNLGGFRLIEYDFREQNKQGSKNDIEATSIGSGTEGNTDSSNKNLEGKEVGLETQNVYDSEVSDPTTNVDTLHIDCPYTSPKEEFEIPNSQTNNRTQLPSLTSAHLLTDPYCRESFSSSMAPADSINSYSGSFVTQVNYTSPPNSNPTIHVESTSKTNSDEGRRTCFSETSDIVRVYSHVPSTSFNQTNMLNHYHHQTVMQLVGESPLIRMVTSEVGVTEDFFEAPKKQFPPAFKNSRIYSALIFFAKNCLRPASFVVIISLIIAFVPWLKALFVTTPNTPYIHPAPDNMPPLSILIEFTEYIGDASVPFGLLLLGATLGRLKIGRLYPGFWKAAAVLVVLRQCIMPIFGVLWIDRLVKANWLSWENDKVALFIIALNWGLPSMTTAIYFTASYTAVDEENPIQMECISFFLLLQYPLLVVSLPFLSTYLLKVQMKL